MANSGSSLGKAGAAAPQAGFASGPNPMAPSSNAGTTKPKEEDDNRRSCSTLCFVIAGTATIAVFLAIFVGLAFGLPDDDDDSDENNGQASFDDLVSQGSCPTNPPPAVMQSSTAEFFVSVEFPLAAGYSDGCASDSFPIEQAVTASVPAPPDLIFIAHPAPETVQITITHQTQSDADGSAAALADPSAVASVAAAIESSMAGADVLEDSIGQPVTGRILSTASPQTDDMGGPGGPGGPSTDDTGSGSGGGSGGGSSSEPDAGDSGSFAFPPVRSTFINELFPVADGKVAVLARQSSKGVWASMDPQAGTIEFEELLTERFTTTILDGGMGPFQAVLDGKVYFGGNGTDSTGTTSGMELWSYDGETQEMVADIYPGWESSEPQALIAFDNKIVCQATMPNPGASFEFPTLVVYDPTTGQAEHPFPASDTANYKKYYQSGSVHNGKLYIKYGNLAFVWTGTGAPTSLQAADSFYSFGARVFGSQNQYTYEIDQTTETFTQLQQVELRSAFTASGKMVGRYIEPQNDYDEYIYVFDEAQDTFNPVVQVNSDQGIEGRVSQDTEAVFDGKYFFAAGSGTSWPLYMFDGTGTPTAVGQQAAFTSNIGALVYIMSVTSNGLYFKPTVGQFSADPSEAVPQDFIAIRAGGVIEVVDVGDMRTSSLVSEVHGVEYIGGSVEEISGLDAAVVLALDAP